MWRHGDVLIVQVDMIPPGATRRSDTVLAEGEITGHRHRIEEQDAAEIWEYEGMLYLKIIAPIATVIHEEHKPIPLDRGTYRVWRQREYTPQAIRPVYD